MHGHLIPVDVVLNDDSGSTSGAYLVYQKLVVFRHAMVVTLLLLPFFEVSAEFVGISTLHLPSTRLKACGEAALCLPGALL